MRLRDFSLNFASPVLNASSTIKISGRTVAATENAKRAYIPDEYVRIGASIASPNSENSAISSKWLSISSRDIPAANPPK